MSTVDNRNTIEGVSGFVAALVTFTTTNNQRNKMEQWHKCMIESIEFGRIPVVKNADNLRDGWIGELVETCGGKFYQIRRSMRGALVALEV